jgi:hypothetical protein
MVTQKSDYDRIYSPLAFDEGGAAIIIVKKNVHLLQDSLNSATIQ